MHRKLLPVPSHLVFLVLTFFNLCYFILSSPFSWFFNVLHSGEGAAWRNAIPMGVTGLEVNPRDAALSCMKLELFRISDLELPFSAAGTVTPNVRTSELMLAAIVENST